MKVVNGALVTESSSELPQNTFEQNDQANEVLWKGFLLAIILLHNIYKNILY